MIGPHMKAIASACGGAQYFSHGRRNNVTQQDTAARVQEDTAIRVLSNGNQPMNAAAVISLSLN